VCTCVLRYDQSRVRGSRYPTSILAESHEHVSADCLSSAVVRRGLYYFGKCVGSKDVKWNESCRSNPRRSLCIIAQVGDSFTFADGKGWIILSVENVLNTLLVGKSRRIPRDINIYLQ